MSGDGLMCAAIDNGQRCGNEVHAELELPNEGYEGWRGMRVRRIGLCYRHIQLMRSGTSIRLVPGSAAYTRRKS